MRSYTSVPLGARERGAELWRLARYEAAQVSPVVAADLAQMREVEQVCAERLGLRLRDLDVLEIGSGPNSRQLAFLARENRAVGIDPNVVPRGANPRDWLALVRHNGVLRAAKTLARRALGIDRRYRRETLRALGAARWPGFRMLRMDATRLELEDAALDLVFSRAVFEHIDDPGAALQEIRRVLRPGGGLVVILHLYTSDSGCHDARLLTEGRGALPYWPHLRPAYADRVRPNAYLNRLGLADWTALFAAHLPGANVTARCDAGPDHVEALHALRAAGELADYRDEELLSPTVWATWSKPAAPQVADARSR